MFSFRVERRISNSRSIPIPRDYIASIRTTLKRTTNYQWPRIRVYSIHWAGTRYTYVKYTCEHPSREAKLNGYRPSVRSGIVSRATDVHPDQGNKTATTYGYTWLHTNVYTMAITSNTAMETALPAQRPDASSGIDVLSVFMCAYQSAIWFG